ncbi:MAG: cation-transporting P-type ATPase [Desulfosudis oleivorans]|nr:cation-transporting P-type ATPase [Desulfosudis oleivorans]
MPRTAKGKCCTFSARSRCVPCATANAVLPAVPAPGLNAAEVAERLRSDGPNTLPEHEPRPVRRLPAPLLGRGAVDARSGDRRRPAARALDSRRR